MLYEVITGLSRAYRETTISAIEEAGAVEIFEEVRFRMRFGYPEIQKLKNLIEGYGRVEEEKYSDAVEEVRHWAAPGLCCPAHAAHTRSTSCPAVRITSYNVCYTKLLRSDFEKYVGLDWLFHVRGPIEPPPEVAVI